MKKYNHFLVTGIKIELPQSKIPNKGIFEFPSIFSDNDYSFSIITTTNQHEDSDFIQGMFYLKTNGKTIKEAEEIVHSLECSIMLFHFCITKTLNETILPINDVLMLVHPPWSYKIITQNSRHEMCPPYYNSVRDFYHYFFSYSQECFESMRQVIKISGYLANDHKIYEASSFLFKSVTELIYDSCDWRESNYSPDFDGYVNIATKESAQLNAYKAIEAILGDLGNPKNEERIIKKLKKNKFNPFYKIGYGRKEYIKDKIIRHLYIRDKITGHGSTEKRNIKLSEIIDLQELSRYLILEKGYQNKIKLRKDRLEKGVSF